MIVIPRGLTVMVDGVYEEDEDKMEMAMEHDDEHYGVLESHIGSKKDKDMGFNLKNYE